ncbi:hypothetical protein [Bradyrhizobium sp. 62B]|uniref:hypothetical protein n=1 Tax=Bradyrhizobium sp. 62B TaxID=2898442 RepID=UPI002557CB8B
MTTPMPLTISQRMARIRKTDTKPELLVRRMLYALKGINGGAQTWEAKYGTHVPTCRRPIDDLA